MKRAVAVVTLVTFGLAACGSGDTEPNAADEPAAEPAEEPAEEPAAEPAEEPAEEPAAEPAEEPAAEPAEEPADDSSGDGGNGTAISSLDDIPQECRDVMADFLRELEPVVTQVDWQTATLQDFEGISADFETLGEDFDAESVEAGCDDLDIDDDGFDLVIEFANDVAPGTVPFFEFLDQMMGSVGTGSTPDDGSTTGALETCDDAIAAIQALVAEYDGLSQVPVSQMSALTSLGSVMMSCTPEQLEYFDSPEVSDFLER